MFFSAFLKYAARPTCNGHRRIGRFIEKSHESTFIKHRGLGSLISLRDTSMGCRRASRLGSLISLSDTSLGSRRESSCLYDSYLKHHGSVRRFHLDRESSLVPLDKSHPNEPPNEPPSEPPSEPPNEPPFPRLIWEKLKCFLKEAFLGLLNYFYCLAKAVWIQFKKKIVSVLACIMLATLMGVILYVFFCIFLGVNLFLFAKDLVHLPQISGETNSGPFIKSSSNKLKMIGDSGTEEIGDSGTVSEEVSKNN